MRFVVLMFFAFFFSLGNAQTYPSKPIRLVVPFPPGETMDIMSRLIAPKMSERLGQQVVVENKPGASGMLGLDQVAKAPPDGYTIGGAQGGNLAVLPHTSKNIPYDAIKDFAPIALSTTNYLGIVAGQGAPFKTIEEMVAYAKANPGKLTVASNGEGGFPHLAFEQLGMMGGFKFTHVPYKGAAAISTDIMGGQVMAGIAGISSVASLINNGRLRLLAITNPARVSLWKDVPSAAEAVPGYDSRGWFGYVAPAGTPRAIVEKLNREINLAIKQRDVQEKLETAGMIVVTESPEAFAEFIKAEHAKYGKIVKAIGYQPQ